MFARPRIQRTMAVEKKFKKGQKRVCGGTFTGSCRCVLDQVGRTSMVGGEFYGRRGG